MNFMDLYLLDRANKLGANLNVGTVADGFPTAQTAVGGSTIPNAPHTVPVLMTMNSRNNNAHVSTWNAAPNGEPDYHASLNNITSIEQCFWGSMGGGMQPDADSSSAAESEHMVSVRNNQEMGGASVLYAKDDRVGEAQNWFGYASSTSYTPIMMGVMFVKNMTSSDIVKTLGLTYSTGNANGHFTGAGIATITPNNTSKTATTGATSANHLLINTSGSTNTSGTGSVTFAAQKTTAVVFSCSGNNWGASGNLSMGTIRCHLTGLDGLFDGSLEPDLKMHATALQTRNNSFTRSQPYLLWKECGDVLGNK